MAQKVIQKFIAIAISMFKNIRTYRPHSTDEVSKAKIIWTTGKIKNENNWHFLTSISNNQKCFNDIGTFPSMFFTSSSILKWQNVTDVKSLS